MNCPTDAVLRSRMDQELSAPECVSVDEHLRCCANCRARLAALTQGASHVRDLFKALAPSDETPIDYAHAFARFQESFDDSTDEHAGSTRYLFGQ
jgi:predicted anti-sigma-YlaC factor YlaD